MFIYFSGHAKKLSGYYLSQRSQKVQQSQESKKQEMLDEKGRGSFSRPLVFPILPFDSLLLSFFSLFSALQ